ncbi:MAG: hypothetical protein AB9869_21570 [Verrucomicrobiia bacterium]
MTTSMASDSEGSTSLTPAERARIIRQRLPASGLFAGQQWRTSPDPFPLPKPVVAELESLGRVLLQFYRAVNLLYRQSAAGKEAPWVAEWLDLGKPGELLEMQRSPAFKNDVPRVIRPDLLLVGDRLAITELDSVPGGIGLTAWLNEVYSSLPGRPPQADPAAKTPTAVRDLPGKKSDRSEAPAASSIIGGSDAMLRGFRDIFGAAPKVHIVVSEESATYKPEMEWVAQRLGDRFQVRDSEYMEFGDGDAAYRFFELFDLDNVRSSRPLFELARNKKVLLTPPPKPVFEEKMLFALLWNRNLHGFWRRELGERFFTRLLRLIPYTWLVDPGPLPPHAAIPELNLTDWAQLKALSQRERELILKVSGFAETAWGARGVYLGSDLPAAEWSAAVDLALREFARTPFVLQRYYKPAVFDTQWFDFERDEVAPMKGRVRLCPFYFVVGEGDAARAHLGGVLATICPADKKIIHGMNDAILAPCSHERV